MELSEICALCLSRLVSIFKLVRIQTSLTPAASSTKESFGLPLALKLQLNLQDVNMFTLSNVAGEYSWKASCFTIACFFLPLFVLCNIQLYNYNSARAGAVMFRVDEVVSSSSAESSQASVRGVALSILKSLSESTEPCCPADQACSPVVSLSSLTVSYQNSSHTLEVPQSHSLTHLNTMVLFIL